MTNPHGQDNLVEKHGLHSTPYEAFIIHEAGLDDRLENAWFVEVGGRKVDTCKFIRKGQTKIVPPSKTEKQPTDETRTPRRSGGSSSYTRSAATIWEEIHLIIARIAARAARGTEDRRNHPGPISRTQCRMVLQLPGWPIERLATRLELLESLRGIVCELEELYKRGIVHRDVSPGNVIISGNGGHLIDFDHSKYTGAFMDTPFRKNADLSESDKEILETLLDQDAMKHAIVVGDRALEYVTAVRRIWSSLRRATTIADFCWPEERYPLPDFKDHTPGPGFLTGTPAFASCRVGPKPHNAIHDLDSLWWTVTFIPLHHAGPGGIKRKDQPEDIIKHYYNGGPAAKVPLYENDGFIELDEIFAKFPPYFKDLVPLMRQWFTFLRAAFYYSGYEYYYPHRILLKILDEAIEREKQKGPETDATHLKETTDEYQRRDEEKRDTQEAITKQPTVPLLRNERKANKPHREVQLSDLAAQQDPSTQTLNPEPETVEVTTLGSRSREGLWSPNTRPSKERPQKRTKSDPQ